ncbi:MAG: B12-binding domain-containing protein [Proteobacteria bacterium]|nr:B12-binding domain-containing protein [Pseudomonadota bacterium]
MSDDKLVKAISECRETEVFDLVKDKLDKGHSVTEMIDDLAEGLRLLGEQFSRGESFIPELVYGGVIFNKSMEMIRPKLNTDSGMEKKGKILIATVKGDMHDIGKNLVGTFLNFGGYEVIDLGVDVPNEKLIEAIERENPDVVGLSALLTTTMFNQRDFVKSLVDKGLRDKIKVIVGGPNASQAWAEEIGADAYGADAVDGKNKIDSLLGN